jgi:hypothetical protein
MQGTSGGRDLKARYYCSTRRANRSCDQPIIPAERVEQQLVEFLTGFAPNKAVQKDPAPALKPGHHKRGQPDL